MKKPVPCFSTDINPFRPCGLPAIIFLRLWPSSTTVAYCQKHNPGPRLYDRDRITEEEFVVSRVLET